jgi:hypothetical protein
MSYDKTKYEVSKEMPERFAAVIPGIGVQHFQKKFLTDNDLKALVLAKNAFVKKVSKDEADYKEDSPELKDIGKGLYPQ